MQNSICLNNNQLKILRTSKYLSQEALANESLEKGYFLSLSTIKRAELGKPVSYRTALNFSRLFDVELERIAQR